MNDLPAVQWLGYNVFDMCVFMGQSIDAQIPNGPMSAELITGEIIVAKVGQWVVKDGENFRVANNVKMILSPEEEVDADEGKIIVRNRHHEFMVGDIFHVGSSTVDGQGIVLAEDKFLIIKSENTSTEYTVAIVDKIPDGARPALSSEMACNIWFALKCVNLSYKENGSSFRIQSDYV